MYHHIKRLMYMVRVGKPDPRFGNVLLEQFGGANGELAAAMQYSIRGLNCEDPARKDLLMDIGKIPPTPGIVEQFFNDSTGKGDNGDVDARGPWNQGDGVNFVQAPSQPIAAATEQEVTREIHNAVRRGPARAAKLSRSKNGR